MTDYNEETGEEVYLTTDDSEFERVDVQETAGQEGTIDTIVVIKHKVTGELWGADHYRDSWHEEPWDIDEEDIGPVELQQVTREEWVFVE